MIWGNELTSWCSAVRYLSRVLQLLNTNCLAGSSLLALGF